MPCGTKTHIVKEKWRREEERQKKREEEEKKLIPWPSDWPAPVQVPEKVGTRNG